jgi:hypothetical protein
MPRLGVVVVLGGLAAVLVATAKVNNAAFRESRRCGWSSLLVPLVAWFFMWTHWKEARSGFFWAMSGVALILVGAALIFAQR